MKNSLLACAKCKGELTHEGNRLFCVSCKTNYAYENGIYYQDATFCTDKANVTIDEFGKRWNKVFKSMGGLKTFLLPMIEPVQQNFFKDKIIVDAGGGFGRLSKILLEYGARHVVLIDASSAVIAAQEYLKDYLDRVTIIRGDLLHPPLADGKFDLFFCHGVLHHTGDARTGILNMCKLLNKKNGAMILWVYAKEGNALTMKFVNLMQIISLKVGDKGRWFMAGVVDVMLFLLTYALYHPLNALFRIKNKLWYGEYLMDFLFDPKINNRTDRMQMYHDFLTTRIIEYYSKLQLEQWVAEAGFKKAEYFFYRKQSWSVAASYKAAETFE